MIMRSKFSVFILLILLIFIVLTGCNQNKKNEKNMNNFFSNNKRAILVVAFEGFQDFEYSETKKILEEKGIKTITVSSSKGTALGKMGQKIEIDKTLEEINAEDGDALIFIGGPGALEYVNNALAHQLANQFSAQNKVLAAICIAPEILAEAGLLKDKKATVWSNQIDQSAIQILEKNKALYVNQPVIIDGKIITANGPEAAKIFGQTIVDVLNQ